MTTMTREIHLDTLSTGVERDRFLGADRLRPGARLTVRTRNSVYHVVVLQLWPLTVVLRGGPYFRSPREARLVGSLDLDAITLYEEQLAIGSSMVISVGNRGFVTSTVVEITVEGERAEAAQRLSASNAAADHREPRAVGLAGTLSGADAGQRG